MNREKNKVIIIIPNYNSWGLTKKNIILLKKQGSFFDILVIDDNSKDNSFISLKKIKGIKLLKNKTNIGCGESLNRGIEYSLKKKYDFLILTDNDAFPVNKNLIKNLILKLKENSSLGFVVPTNLKDKKSKKEGFIEGWMFHFFTIKREVIEKIGGIDKNYFLQVEDLDYSTRILKRGYKGFQIKELYFHADKKESWVNPNFIYYTIRNSFYYNKKFNKGTKKIRESLKLKLKVGVINAFSRVNNLDLKKATYFAREDFIKKNMGKCKHIFQVRKFKIGKNYLSPRELYLSSFNEKKQVYLFELIRVFFKLK